jgi:hypothetical protein
METATPTRRGRAAKPRYARHPWPSWFARRSFVLFRGHDYAGMSHAMAQQVRSVASRKRLSVEVDVRENPDRIEVRIGGKLPRRK